MEEKVAIDARMIESSGIGTYIRNLMGQGIYDVALGDEESIRKYDRDVTVIPFKDNIYGIGEQIHFPYRELKKLGITKLHSPHYNIPLFFRGKLVVTIHDLIHLRLPEYLPNKFAYGYAWIMLKTSAVKAKLILTVSEYTKKDITELLHISPEKIQVTYNALEEGYRIKRKEEYAYLYKEYGIAEDEKILLYVGNLKPHKNLGRLIQAFSQISILKARLILVGKEFSNQDIHREITRRNIQDKVIVAGKVSHSKLIDLYNFADVFVFPSLYEGFGFPPLEAMACGTVVACSNAASLPEVVGEAGFLFDPVDIEQMRAKIENALMLNKYTYDQMVKKGYERVSFYNKEKVIGLTDELIKSI